MSAALLSMMPNAAPARAPSMLGQLAAFLVIGAAGAVGFVALSSTVTQITGAQGWVPNALCYAVLVGPVYLAHRRFSFQSSLPHEQALPRYIGVQLVALGLVTLFSFIIYSIFALPAVAAAMLVIALTAGVNFMVLRGWAFAKAAPLALPRPLRLRAGTHE
ncbi:GtrA family protein [uncultured Devosia sp.]|uniref:GtrA family protein n=1 Tax=uncultured Devosia sp. TaxID=211434 RepID=UPI0035CCA64E